MASPTLPSNIQLVNIGTHSLALYSHIPASGSSKDPVVLFVSGVASDALNWQAVVRLLGIGTILRSYTYDRSGYRNSESSPLPPSAENIALELSLLIERAPIRNQIILVGHSWAGIIMHEYIALKGTSQLAGLVFVDANHETTPLVMNVNDPILWTVAANVDFYTACGLEAGHKFTQEEWDAFKAAKTSDKYKVIACKEDENYMPSFDTLRKKELSKKQPLLGNKPVYVIGGLRSRDWKGLYEAGVAIGNGTEEQKSYVRELIEKVDEKAAGLQKEFLKLSTKSELVVATNSGHFVQVTQPEVIVNGVKWVLDNLSESS